MSVQILLRRGTAQQWTDANPLLAAGEPGVETDTGKFKIGDGTTDWVQLPYAVGEIPTDISDLTDSGNLIPIDISDLTDTGNLIPTDIGNLTDLGNLIPEDISDLTDNDDLIPRDLSDLTDTTGVLPRDLSDLTDNSNRIPTDLSQLNDSTFIIPTDINQLNDSNNLIVSSLTDLGISDGTAGQVLTATGTGNFLFDNLPAIPEELDDFNDVNILGPVDGEILRYNGSSWVNGPFRPDENTRYDLTTSATLSGASVILSGTDATTAGFDIASSTGITVSVVDNNIQLGLDTGNIEFQDNTIVGNNGTLNLVSSDGRIVLGSPNGTEVEVTNAVGSGTVVTLAYAEEPIAPFAVGTTIVVTGMTPINYNGEYTVASCSTTQVTFNSSVTATFVSGGTITGSKSADNGGLLVALPYFDSARSAISINQCHDNTNTMNLQFFRARGTNEQQEVVQDTDRLGGMIASARGQTGTNLSGSIVFAVEGSVVGNNIPTKIRFGTNDGSTFRLSAEISPLGVLRVNSITSLTGDLTLASNGGTVRLPAGTTIGGVTVGTLVLEGVVDEVANLPSTGNTTGDVYVVRNLVDGGPASVSLWSGSVWVDLGDFQGPAGQGVAAGGAPGQILSKASGTPYDTQWVTPFDGNYGSLNGLPELASVATSGDFNDLASKPDFATVATTGDYADLINTPTIPAEQVNSDWNATTGKAVIFNKPIIPASPVNADWTSTTGLSEILNKPTFATVATTGDWDDILFKPNFATVATSGSYTDLTNKPTVPTDVSQLADSTGVIPTVLTDLGITDGAIGQVLTTNGAGGFTFTTVSGGGGSTTLDGLSDVVITTPTTGQVLKYNGTNWVNGTDDAGEAPDGNTTYSLSATTVSGGANITLSGSDTTTDNLKLMAGSNVTITRTDADTITIASTGSGGGGLTARGSVSGATSSLASGATGPINITGYKGYALLKVETSAAAWVRIYVSEAARLADASRTEGTDPLPGSGVIAEVITTGAETVLISPGTIGFNDESVVTTNIPVRVTNKSGSTQAITVTLTAIQLEA
jgi:hypothetical protein